MSITDGAKIGRKIDTCKKVTENFVVSYYFCTFAEDKYEPRSMNILQNKHNALIHKGL